MLFNFLGELKSNDTISPLGIYEGAPDTAVKVPIAPDINDANGL